MSPRRRLVCLLAAAALALGASAYVPPPARIANAVADTNRGARRHVPLAIEVELTLGPERNVVASGTLTSEPSGNARIELVSPRGTLERHLRRGSVLSATREGRAVAAPRPFLPPFFLLQAGDVPTLVRLLAATGIRPGRMTLGYEGRNNCFVFGDRADGAGSLWVDQETLETVRIDLPDGSRFRLGPAARFGRIQLPAWIEVSLADRRIGRLVVKGARTLRPDASRFDAAWLEGAAER